MEKSLKGSVSSKVLRGRGEVHGGSVLVFGDLHLSAKYSGTHRNYVGSCYRVMDSILEKVKAADASAVVLLGDLFGVKERNITDRQFLYRVIQFFREMGAVTGGKVYAVQGNHDMGEYPDFEFLKALGLFENPEFVDYYGDGGLEVRFHFLNYGEERKEIEIAEGASNVVFGHNDYSIPGTTTWYESRDSVVLSSLTNLEGVDMVISGHIHTPSPEIYETYLESRDSEGAGDKSISLFYVGSPARVSERFEECWYVEFLYDGGGTGYEAKKFGLWSVLEEFLPPENLVMADGEALERVERTERLTEILSEVMGSKAVTGDIFLQIDKLPGVSDKVRGIAREYLQRSVDMGN